MQTNKQISIATLISLIFLTSCTNSASTTPQTDINTPISTAQDSSIKTSTETAWVKAILATPSDIVIKKDLAYKSPAGQESINVSLTTKDGIITNVTATPLATNPISIKLQSAFASDISKNVIGKTIKGLKVDTVSWASLTTGAFNEYIASVN